MCVFSKHRLSWATDNTFHAQVSEVSHCFHVKQAKQPKLTATPAASKGYAVFVVGFVDFSEEISKSAKNKGSAQDFS